jgi:hypothetical protein
MRKIVRMWEQGTLAQNWWEYKLMLPLGKIIKEFSQNTENRTTI